MTEAQKIQYDRFIGAGCDPEDAAMLVDRGVWLGTTETTLGIVAEIEEYRRERDATARSEDERA